MSKVGAQRLLSYIHRNASYELQKAYAITVMSTAMCSWSYNISDAGKIASQCTQFSAQTVCQWASSFFGAFHEHDTGFSEMVDDVEMEEILSSERGKSPSYLSSLIHNEKFQLEIPTRSQGIRA